jgi:hypothetical protein
MADFERGTDHDKTNEASHDAIKPGHRIRLSGPSEEGESPPRVGATSSGCPLGIFKFFIDIGLWISHILRGASSPRARSIGFWGPRCPWQGAQGWPACRSLRLGRRPIWVLFVRLLQFPRPHHVLRPRDRYRTITPLLLIGVLPEPVHTALSDAKISTITQLARVPWKELPQEAPSNPIPICPPPALADLHDAHPHSGFTMRQHSAHFENSPVPHKATQTFGFLSALRPCHAHDAVHTLATALFPDRG